MPKKIKPYQYRIKPQAAPEHSYGKSVIRTGTKEVLSGRIMGMKASDLEERVARAMDKIGVRYGFRVRLTSEFLGARRLTQQFRNVRGEIEMDFLPEPPHPPIFVDGQISHYYTAWQADADKSKTAAVDEFFRMTGPRKAAVRIPFWQLQNQDAADKTIRDIFTL
jgi:hypothetical protein